MYFYFDSLVKSGIEVVGSSVLGTAVTVEGASVSPLNGQGNISGLRVENPEGYNSQYAFELDSVAVSINVGSVFSDVLEVDSITIVQPTITYETKITTDNIRALLANRPAIFAAAMSIVRHHAPSWCHLVPPHTASRSREMERSAQSWQELSAVDHIA